MKNYLKNTFASDFLSSLVVFLVALPLCMGIAIASGVDPMMGLLSGIIGGLVVGVFAGSPLQVSGPAAGLAVMVFQYIEQYGMPALVPLGIIVGVVQISMWRFRLAPYFRAISPALIKGMLAGIGLLILISQVHISLLHKPGGNGLKNILSLPEVFFDGLISSDKAQVSFGMALLTVALIIGWQKLFPKLNKRVPGPLFAIVVAAVLDIVLALDIAVVGIPHNLIEEIRFISFESFSHFSPGLVLSSIAIAFVASAESLLCVTAVDRITREKSDYDQEIFAQGVGNFIAGMVGALPITGVIVRSSANIESGGKTRMAAIMHGVWLLVLVFFFPKILSLIPIAALAGILIFTGIKLLDLKSIPEIFATDKKDGMVFILTLALITVTDLLTGVMVGFGASLIMLMIDTMKLHVEKEENDGQLKFTLTGKATFLHIPRISKSLHSADEVENKEIILDFSGAQFVDKVIRDEVANWAIDAKERNVVTKVLYPEHNRRSTSDKAI